MFGCAAEFDAANQCAGLCGFERFVKRSFGVRVEVIANQHDIFTIRVVSFQMEGHLIAPSLSLFNAFGWSPDARLIEVR